MSVQATTWVWEHSQAEGTDRLVLLAFADAANREGERSCQSVTTIMRMARVSRSTVKRSIHSLQELGELEHTGTDGEYQTKVYRLPGMSPGGVQADPQEGGVQNGPGSIQNKGGGSIPGFCTFYYPKKIYPRERAVRSASCPHQGPPPAG